MSTSSVNKKLYYFTFGDFAEDEEYTNCVQPILASDWGKARDLMMKKFGTKWAFQYTEREYLKGKEDMKKRLNNLGIYIPSERELPVMEAD